MDRAVDAAREAFDRRPLATHGAGRAAEIVARMAEILKGREPELAARLDRADRRARQLRADGGRHRDEICSGTMPSSRATFEFVKPVPSTVAATGRAGARAGRRGRRDRAVERALCDHGGQGRAGLARGLHDRDEAVARDAARGLYHRRGGRGGGPAAGRAQPRLRRPRGLATISSAIPAIDKVSFTGSERDRQPDRQRSAAGASRAARSSSAASPRRSCSTISRPRRRRSC